MNNRINKVAMMQPAFLPWQGLFELITASDIFIFLDDFQYSVQSHHTRNRLFVNKNQIGYYNVPIQKTKSFEAPLNHTFILNDLFWKNKLLRKIEYNYKKTAYFNEIFINLEAWLTQQHETLAELNITGIKMFCSILNISSTFLYSSDFTKVTNSKSTRSKKIVELLEWAKAEQYICAFGSFEYMQEDNYDYLKYPVLFQNFQPQPYKQIHSETFIPYLSVLDALFNIGPTKTLELIKNGTKKWLTWEERKLFVNTKEEKTCTLTS